MLKLFSDIDDCETHFHKSWAHEKGWPLQGKHTIVLIPVNSWCLNFKREDDLSSLHLLPVMKMREERKRTSMVVEAMAA